MEKKKLNLETLAVQSFITKLGSDAKTVIGAAEQQGPTIRHLECISVNYCPTPTLTAPGCDSYIGPGCLPPRPVNRIGEFGNN